MFKQNIKELITENKNYRALLEWDGEMPFLHLAVYHWSPSSLKQMKIDFKQLLETLNKKGTPYLGAYNTNQSDLWFKFMGVFDFTFTYEFKGLRVYMKSTGEI